MYITLTYKCKDVSLALSVSKILMKGFELWLNKLATNTCGPCAIANKEIADTARLVDYDA